jgi:hypothetical protein
MQNDAVYGRNESMSQRISLFELSERALDETLDKYSQGLEHGYASWRVCRICMEVLTSCRLCPLYPSKWCVSDRLESRLYKTYEKTDWDNDIKSYLWWISIELELMRADYEKHWGGV